MSASAPELRVLGLDVGNGKLKACLLGWRESLSQSALSWESLPLPVTGDRSKDFERALPLQLLDFLDAQGLAAEQLDAVVVCCSHSLSYQPFSASITHLGQILERLFPEQQVWLVRADGVLTPVSALRELSSRESYAYTFTNFYGSALLGSRLLHNGISLDLGTTTLDVIPIQQGQIDPIGLADPAGYLRFRYAHSRIHWLGLTTVPLAMLADQVPLGGRSYRVVPRHYKADILLALHPQVAPDLMARHAYGRHFPSPERARQQLAQFIGLDDVLLQAEEIQAIWDFLFERLLAALEAGIAAVVTEQPQALSELEWAIFALGEEVVLRPVLQRLGVAERQIRRLELGRHQAVWSASSVFAMALLAAEQLLGRRISLEAYV
ncbi:MAG: hypothetical protein ACO1RX_23275 [Candidatus Sericytochromatia bacterium]